MHTHSFTYSHTCTHIYVRIRAFTHTCTHTGTCIHTCVYTHLVDIHTHSYAPSHLCILSCTYKHTYIPTLMHTYTSSNTCTYTHAYTHTHAHTRIHTRAHTHRVEIRPPTHLHVVVPPALPFSLEARRCPVEGHHPRGRGSVLAVPGSAWQEWAGTSRTDCAKARGHLNSCRYPEWDWAHCAGSRPAGSALSPGPDHLRRLDTPRAV